MYEVFDQRHAWTFKTTNSLRRAKFTVWLYNRLGWQDVEGNTLRFDYAIAGMGWMR